MLPVPNSVGLPPVKSSVCVYWNEASSDEAPGWYYANVEEHSLNGQTKIVSSNHPIETLDLCSLHWELTRKGKKKKTYLPP